MNMNNIRFQKITRIRIRILVFGLKYQNNIRIPNYSLTSVLNHIGFFFIGHGEHGDPLSVWHTRLQICTLQTRLHVHLLFQILPGDFKNSSHFTFRRQLLGVFSLLLFISLCSFMCSPCCSSLARSPPRGSPCGLRTNLPRKGHLQVILDKVLGPELDITCFLDLMAEGRSLLGWAVGRTCNGWEKGTLYFTCGCP